MELCQFLNVAGAQITVGWPRYLAEVVRPLHILRTLADLELSIFVLGSVRDPQAISYSRTVGFDRNKRPQAAVISPDPRVATGWRHRDALSRATYECRSTKLSRLEELELLEWTEQNHIIAPEFGYHPSQIPLGAFLNTRSMHEDFERTLRAKTARRGPLRYARASLVRGRTKRAPRRPLRLALKEVRL